MPDKTEIDAIEQSFRGNALRAKRLRRKPISWTRIGGLIAAAIFFGTFAVLLFMHYTGWRP